MKKYAYNYAAPKLINGRISTVNGEPSTGMPLYAIGLLTISTLHAYVDRNGSYCRKVLTTQP